MFLKEDSETTWNDSITYYGHISWGEQRNYLKWQLYLLWSCFLRRTAKLPEMTAIPILAMFLERRKTTWNDSYIYSGQVSWGYQRNYLKWQVNLLWPCFLRRTANLPEMTAIPVSCGGQANYLKWQLYLLRQYFLTRTVKLPEMTAIPI